MAEKPKIDDERLEQVMAYYGGDLTGDELAEFEAHLASCEGCQNALRLAKKALPMAEAMLAFKPKHTIDEQVARFEAMWAEKKAHEAVVRRPRTRLWFALTLGAALTAAAAWAFLRMAAQPVNPGNEVYAPPQPRTDGG